MGLITKYKKWRIGHLHQKMEKLQSEYEWAFHHKDLLGEIEYEKYTDAVATSMVYVKRALARLGVADEEE